MRAVRWSARAKADFENAVAYRALRSERGAINLDRAVRQAVDKLAETNSGRRGRVAETFEKVVPRYPYIILFEADEDEVRVLRIVHGSRFWPEGAWPPIS